MKMPAKLLFPLLGALCLAGPALAAASAKESCEVYQDKICDVRKFASCGPIDLSFWVSDKGERHCQRARIALTPTNVMPSLRRLRCYFYASDGDIVFDAENYIAVQGPSQGDRIAIRNGVGETLITGQYRTMSEESVVIFENTGPARSVILKCNGYGPA